MILSIIRICRSTIHLHITIGTFHGWPLFVLLDVELEDYEDYNA